MKKILGTLIFLSGLQAQASNCTGYMECELKVRYPLGTYHSYDALLTKASSDLLPVKGNGKSKCKARMVMSDDSNYNLRFVAEVEALQAASKKPLLAYKLTSEQTKQVLSVRLDDFSQVTMTEKPPVEVADDGKTMVALDRQGRTAVQTVLTCSYHAETQSDGL